jgi:hypothetical protein
MSDGKPVGDIAEFSGEISHQSRTCFVLRDKHFRRDYMCHHETAATHMFRHMDADPMDGPDQESRATRILSVISGPRSG